MGRFDALTQLNDEPAKEPKSPAPTPAPKKQPVKETVKKVTEAKKPTNPQTGLYTKDSPSPIETEKPEKYTTHLEPWLIKKIKIHALQKDLKDYEVVRKALLLYFEKTT